MKKLELIKKIKLKSCAVAVSDDEKILAVGCDSNIKIVSYPEMEILQVLPIKYAGDILFLKNSYKLIMFSPTQLIRMWDGKKIIRLGKFPDHYWNYGPFFCVDNDLIAFGSFCDVVFYNWKTKKFKEIYSSGTNRLYVAGYQDEIFHLLVVPPENESDYFKYVTINLQGEVCSSKNIEYNFDKNSFSAPVLINDSNMAFISKEKGIFKKNSLFVVNVDGNIKKYNCIPESWSKLKLNSFMYATCSGDYLGFIDGLYSEEAVLFDSKNVAFIGKIVVPSLNVTFDENKLDMLFNINFLSNNIVLFGSDKYLFIYKIVEEI